MPDLLATKLYMPRPRRSLLPRPRLVGLLQAAVDLPLILVSAPAGFGKTTLLSAWNADDLLHQAGVRSAWLSLDSGDNDPIRFASYLIAAFASLSPSIQPDLLYTALRSSQTFPLENALVPLINQLTRMEDQTVLVLDDLHTITNPTIYSALSFLVENLPPAVHLVFSTRSDPPLPLARWRASGLLSEIREPDLRFTREEILAFLQQGMGLSLSPEDAAGLESLTEGWVAGLQMAAIARRSSPAKEGPANSLTGFNGSHRYVMDYLTEEVLQHQPLPVQRFLLFTSILERISAPLCEAIFNGDEAADFSVPGADEHLRHIRGSPYQEILQYLEQANLFLVPLDDHREWYRYHHLFAEALRNHLNFAYPQLIPDLHCRASDWYFDHNYRVEAVEHALAAQDYERAARFIDPAADYLVRVGEISTILKWFHLLPAEVIQSSPELSTWFAWCYKINGNFDAIEPLLQNAYRALEKSGVPLPLPEQADPLDPAVHRVRSILGQAAIMRGSIALSKDSYSLALQFSQQAIDILPEDYRYLRLLAVTNLGMVHLFRGEVQAAVNILVENRDRCPPDGHPNIYLGLLSILIQVRIHQGALYEAEQDCRQALDLAGAHNMQSFRSSPLVLLSEIYYEWNRLEEASRCCLEAAQIAEMAGQWAVLFSANLHLAQIRFAQGKSAEAESLLRSAESLLDRTGRSSHRDHLALMRTRLLLSQGRLAEARQAAGPETTRKHPRWVVYAHLTQARLLIAEGSTQEALKLLNCLLQEAHAKGRTSHRLEALILKAQAMYTLSHRSQAYRALESALELAEPDCFTRIFIDQGEPMRALLSSYRRTDSGKHAVAASRLLSAFPPRAPVPRPVQASTPAARSHTHPTSRLNTRSVASDALSDREASVLNLIAAGLSNEAIAQELYISLNTVRTHTKSIYRKLNVRSRTQAVARAQAAGLM